MTKLYQLLASRIEAAANCKRDLDKPGRVDASFLPLRREWMVKHREMAEALARDYLPSGSGFDNGSSIYLDDSAPDKLVLATSFHHMDAHGSYDGWTDHKVTVRPSLVHGFTVDVSGRDRNQIKDCIAEAFHIALSADVSRDDESALAVRLGHMKAPAEA